MTNKSPKVSIITVAFNAAKSIEKTLISVSEQSYENVEYIIIDGGSTDHTMNIVKKYEDHTSLIIQEKDEGIYDAMNKGIRHASGDYIWFIHADDQIFSKDTLKLAMENGKEADFIYGKTIIVDEQGLERGLESRKKHPEQSNLKLQSFLDGMIICHQSMIVKRSITPFYNLNYHLVGDLDWVINIFKTPGITVHDCGHYMCKFVEGGTSTQYRRASLIQRFEILKKHFGLLATLVQHLKIVWKAILRRSIK